MITTAALRLIRTEAGRRRLALIAAAFPLFITIRALLRVVQFRTVLRLVRVVPVIARKPADVRVIGTAVTEAAWLSRAHNSCLAEALTALTMLRAAGVGATLQFEAARSPAGLVAHASVALADGSIVGIATNPRLGVLNPVPQRGVHV